MGYKFNVFTGTFDVDNNSGGGGSSNSFETIQVPNGTSPVATGPTDVLTLAEGTGIEITGDAGTDTVTIAIANGTANAVAGFDNSGVFASFDSLTRNVYNGFDLYQGLSTSDIGNTSVVLNRKAADITPTEVITDSYFHESDYMNVNAAFDITNLTGKEFSIGLSGIADAGNVIMANRYFNFSGSGEFNDITFDNKSIGLGNGTDASVNNNNYFDNINLTINAGHTTNNTYLYNPYVNLNATATANDILVFNASGNLYGTANLVQGYAFNPNIESGSSINNTTAFYSNPGINESVNSYSGFVINGYGTSAPDYFFGINIGPNFAGQMQGYQGVNINTGAGALIDNWQGISINADVTGTYATGVAINPTVDMSSNFNGVQINPTVTGNLTFATGINVSMDNVTVFPGVKAYVTVQDIYYEWDTPGQDAHNFSIEYIGGGTAGSEVVTLIGNIITVQLDSGVSTATQVKAAVDAVPQIAANLSTTITGVGSNPQVIDGPDPFANGQWAGQKYAGYFDGDVSIDGALQFNGALNVGKFNAFASQALTDGGGTPSSVHSLITNPTVAANVTVANADLLGVNTAALINIGDNATVTTAFLGVAALGLPAVLTMGSGSTVDRVAGAVFAISLDATATGGTVDTVSLCRSLALPNGVTTVNRMYGYEFDLPFGDPATLSYGLYIKQPVNNWIEGTLRIGGTAVSDDLVDSGVEFQVDGDSSLKGTVKIGNGQAISQVLSATATLDFPSISSNSYSDLTMTVTGASPGDVVSLGAPGAFEANLTFCGWVSATDTVTVRLHNGSGGATDPASATWRAMVTKF